MMGFKQFQGFVAAAFLTVVAALPAAAETIRIVGFGDSLMAGYRLDPGQSFPETLERVLRERGHDVVIANAGVSGDTTGGGLERLDWSVPDDTDLVLLELGANDMLRGIPPEVTKRNLAAMIERLQERGIEILLIGMLAAPNLGEDYQAAFDGMFPRLARRYGLAFHPFFLEGVAARSDLLLDDGMHPNAEGVERMVEGILPLVEELLSERRSPSREATGTFTLAGAVTYREPIELPEGSTLAVRLVNVALADAPAPIIAETSMPAAGSGPFAYELQVDPEAIPLPAANVLEAEILHGGRLLFRETLRYDETMNGRDDLDIVLELVGSLD